MASPAFETTHAELERAAGMEKWAARGAIQLALMDAGLDAKDVTAAQMSVVVDRLLPKQLQSQKVQGVADVCKGIREALQLISDDPKQSTPDRVFERLGA